MSAQALQAIAQAIQALTVDEIEVNVDGQVETGTRVALLQRSIGRDLVHIERAMSTNGTTLLSATAAAIDEALIALAEAAAELGAKP